MTSLFSQNLWDKTDIVIKHSHNRRKELQQFISILAKRIEVEQSYAKGLRQNAAMAASLKTGSQSIPVYAFTSFKQDCANRAEQTKNFAKSLQQQILLPLKQLSSTQHAETKEYEKQWKSLEKKLSQLEQNIVKAKNKYTSYYSQYQETLMLNEIALSSHKLSNQKKVKVIIKDKELMKTIAELEKNYEKAISEYNSFLTQYYWDIDELLDNLQRQERVRVGKQQDNIMKILILETSVAKNYQYDISSITKTLQKIKSVDTLHIFTDNQKTGKPRYRHKNKHLVKSTLGQSVLKIVDKQIQNKINLERDQNMQSYIEAQFNEVKWEKQIFNFQKSMIEEFDKMFEIVHNIFEKTPSHQDIKSLKVLLNDQYNRLALWMYLKKYESNQKSVLSREKYDSVLAVVDDLLEICSELQDVYIARKLTNFIFIFHYLDETNKKIYSYTQLKRNKMHSSLDYWKAAIFETVQDVLRLNMKQSCDTPESPKYISLVFSQLAMFCHQMIIMGVPCSDVKQCIFMFSKLYELPENQEKDLSKTINFSMLSYTQTLEKEKNNMEHGLVRSVSFDKAIESLRRDKKNSEPNIKIEQTPFEKQMGVCKYLGLTDIEMSRNRDQIKQGGDIEHDLVKH